PFAVVPVVPFAAPPAAPRPPPAPVAGRAPPAPRGGQPERPPPPAKPGPAIPGKPPPATAGAQIFAKGGNAVDAAAAMLAAGCTMWDTLGCGGEKPERSYNSKRKKGFRRNAHRVAPARAAASLAIRQGYSLPPPDRSPPPVA